MRWVSIDLHTADRAGCADPIDYYDHINREPSRLRAARWRTQRHRRPRRQLRCYGARKVWLTLNREGIEVARCTVERLMTKSACPGPPQAATIADPYSPSRRSRPAPPDSPAPNRLWVAGHLCVDLGEVRLRGLCHRRLRSRDPGLAGRFHDGHLHGPHLRSSNPSGPANRRRTRPERRYPPYG